ncbi:RdgB/HAM1 family non-canonical purine NTP pyrophosphatase [Aestuariibacter salexigens]|uniref:RdgB/HAM1 family non-canonical purine NTP pyrophosphatase n=1 Tax=Aestuariibacter salexigens TaxID=226010 RepID=UPI0004174708|nr:RdgB/HAM1 family non-canonical purine NTP pyrophosphatase [Aestuariibacter salexigens]
MFEKIVLATGNPGKVKEFAGLLAEFSIDVVPQKALGVDDAEETGSTFVENAIIKARHACRVTSLPAIADDSGLAVAALKGAPGVYSSRYAGESASDDDNIEKLLGALASTPVQHRAARFICVLVFMRHADDPTPLICQGEWHGEIALKRHGDGGFGYDPVFYVPSQKCTAAQLDKQTKNAISHRGQALKSLLDRLSSALN